MNLITSLNIVESGKSARSEKSVWFKSSVKPIKYSLHGQLQLSCAVKRHYFKFRYLFNHWQFKSL